MDTGNKTLAQLSEEGKEARYVTLEVGAKISGYTKDYLERLCRLHKVNYLERNIGEHVIELESLLKETHTILLSYEGITFVDKSTLNAPSEAALLRDAVSEDDGKKNMEPPPYSTPVPNFAQNGQEEAEAKEDIFSFTGRAVVSDAHHPEERVQKEKAPAAPLSEAEEISPAPAADALPQAVVLPQKKVEFKEAARALHHVVHIPIAAGHDADTGQDEWDARLLGGEESSAEVSAAAPAAQATRSPYHPIVTSRDARDHHEDLPLFPYLIAKDKTLLPAPETLNGALPPGVRTDAHQLLESAEPQDPITAKQISAVSSDAPLSVVADQKPKQRTLTSSLPMMRVMPQLPMMVEEHHLLQMPQHLLVPPAGASLLTKSLGFNIAFMSLLVLSSFWLLAGMDTTGPHNFSGIIDRQIAAAGEAFGNIISTTEDTGAAVSEASEPDERSIEKREFSDEVIITEGDTFGTIRIQPVFKDGTGSVTEYTIDSDPVE